jgi:hypothetical protein
MGYHLESSDKFLFIVDLMNMNPVDHVVFMTLTYDYIEGRPSGFDNMKAIWLDVAQCGTSEVSPPKQKGAWDVGSAWTANIEGEILGAGGHLHDGGQWLSISMNDKMVCNCTATYGVGKGAMTPFRYTLGEQELADGPGEHHNGPGKHITTMSGCTGEQMGKYLKKGQVWKINGHYDYTQNEGMKNAYGSQDNVMAISIMYVKNPHS